MNGYVWLVMAYREALRRWGVCGLPRTAMCAKLKQGTESGLGS